MIITLEKPPFNEEKDGEKARRLQDVHQRVRCLQRGKDASKCARGEVGHVRGEDRRHGEMAGESVDGIEEGRVWRLSAVERRPKPVDVDLVSALMSMRQEDVKPT